MSLRVSKSNKTDFWLKGNIHTLISDEVVKYLLVKDGKIEILTSALSEEKNSASPLPLIDYTGYHILPGFIENHCHLLETGLTLIFPNLEEISKLEDLFDILSTAKKALSPFRFLLCFNFEPEKIKEKRFPTRKELDRVISNIPVIIFRRDGHSAVLNTKGLREFLADEIPEGMELDVSREPTGLLRGKANEIASSHLRQKIDPEIKRMALWKGASLAAKKGITTLVSMTREEDTPILLDLLPSLPIEIIIFCETMDIRKVKGFGLDRIGGCLLIDGSLGSHTAALREDYEDKRGNRGVLYFSKDELLSFQREADRENLQMAFHAIGDRAIELLLSSFEEFLKENSLRHRIEHCELVPPDLLERIARLKLIPSVQPAFEHYWGGEGKMYHQRLGERIRWTNPYKSFVENGLIVLGGSDSPVTPLDPLLGINAALSHPNERERLDLKTAFYLFTKWGAYGIFKEKEIGVLKEGHYADFIVLKGNPLAGERASLIATYKRGEVIEEVNRDELLTLLKRTLR